MVVKEQVHITPYNLDRMLHIYLPDDYYNTDMHYPVMYMYDGHNLFFNEDATYGKSWGLSDYMNETGRQMIIVGLECNHEGNNRLIEFCPYKFKDFDGNYYEGTGKILMDWMSTQLKAYIDHKYRTIPDRAHTGIGGSSMGGLMSFYTVVRHNDVYSRAACLSSSFIFCRNAMKKEVLGVDAFAPDTRIYLSWGSQEARSKNALVKYTSEALEFSNLVTGKGASTHLYLQDKGRHCEADWEKQNDIYMRYLWD